MKKKLQALLKNERGLTLIELLAVVVILGIIAAIAIPSIGGIIDNTKKDAHIANATQMVSAVKTMVAGGEQEMPLKNKTVTVTMKQLEDGDYIEVIKDPSKEDYVNTTSNVVITDTAGVITYNVTLKGKTTTYIDGTKTIDELKRANVTLP